MPASAATKHTDRWYVPQNETDLLTAMRDQLWRLNNLYTIVDKGGRKIPFRLNTAQIELFEAAWYRNDILKSRQHGFTTLIDIWAVDTCVFRGNTTAGIIAHGLREAEKIFSSKVRFPYDNLSEAIRSEIGLTSDTKTSLEFTNGSSIYTGTSMRSGTCQFLHVSEFGKTAARFPDKAVEIMTGALESVPVDGLVIFESTAEGDEGAFKDLDELARNNEKAGVVLTPLDFKAHFWGWHRDPVNVLDHRQVKVTREESDYFGKLDFVLSEDQKAWYVKKQRVMPEGAMYREHPSTPEEAFKGSVEGSYFVKQMSLMRKEGRITSVPYDRSLPVYTFWDLGWDDSMSIWFMQPRGAERRLINYYEDHLENADFYADYLKSLGYSYMQHLMPHDIVSHDWKRGETGQQVFEALGVRPIKKIDRALNQAEIQAGIQSVRNFLGVALIDEQNCARGIKCLDAFRKEWDEKYGKFKERPLKNWAGHCVDALRCGAVGFDGNIHVRPVRSTGVSGRRS